MYGDDKSMSVQTIKNGYLLKTFNKDNFEPEIEYYENKPEIGVVNDKKEKPENALQRAKKVMRPNISKRMTK